MDMLVLALIVIVFWALWDCLCLGIFILSPLSNVDVLPITTSITQLGKQGPHSRSSQQRGQATGTSKGDNGDA
jgi:hypothetical protein